tara:strand:+ start:1387 stop:1959 length:573 start_codon:yes stop_codon:yes gene_type:complete
MNEWREIVKAKGKLSTMPKMRTSLKKIPYTKKSKCNEKLQEYSKYLEEVEGLSGTLPIGKLHVRGYNQRVLKDFKSSTKLEILERVIYLHKPIPEEVACKALEYLQRDETDDIIYRTVKDNSGSNWTVGVRIDNQYEEFYGMKDMGILLVVTNDADDEFSVYLSHRIVVENDTPEDKAALDKMQQKIDWR